MLIAQITDIHIGFDREDPDEANVRRLAMVVEQLVKGANRPDLLLLTGDLTEHGDAASYRRIASLLAACPFPVWPLVGNHDDRAELLAAFPQTPTAGPFIQYALDDLPLRVLALDTVEPGRHGGAFCYERAAWLSEQLSSQPDRPTLIAMHHPPFASRLAWMDPDPTASWIARFAEVIAGHDQVVGVICGHVHRPVVTNQFGTPFVIAPSTAPAVALDLSLIDPDQPDSRAMIRAEPPGYALHHWDGEALVTHFEWPGQFATLARFDAGLQPLVRLMDAERRE